MIPILLTKNVYKLHPEDIAAQFMCDATIKGYVATNVLSIHDIWTIGTIFSMPCGYEAARWWDNVDISKTWSSLYILVLMTRKIICQLCHYRIKVKNNCITYFITRIYNLNDLLKITYCFSLIDYYILLHISLCSNL